MKVTLLLTLSFLLLFAFTPKLALAAELVPEINNQDVQPDSVYDIQRYPLYPRLPYLILPAPFKKGGSVLLAKTEESTCPVSVMLQDNTPALKGDAANFSVVEKQAFIYRGNVTIMDILFEKKPNCVKSNSSAWVAVYDKDIKEAYLGIGGPEDHPGKQIKGGKFHIDYLFNDNFYKLVFCVYKKNYTNIDFCMDVGKSEKNKDGLRRLILTQNEPLEVQFDNTSLNL